MLLPAAHQSMQQGGMVPVQDRRFAATFTDRVKHDGRLVCGVHFKPFVIDISTGLIDHCSVFQIKLIVLIKATTWSFNSNILTAELQLSLFLIVTLPQK